MSHNQFYAGIHNKIWLFANQRHVIAGLALNLKWMRIGEAAVDFLTRIDVERWIIDYFRVNFITIY